MLQNIFSEIASKFVVTVLQIGELLPAFASKRLSVSKILLLYPVMSDLFLINLITWTTFVSKCVFC